jgi:predicted unusual protein kinase regulating ubiquinone biosynthesis (AarF/ABC1/UbiB family)
LLRFVPVRGWDAVEWAPLLGSLGRLSTRYVTERGVPALRRAVAEVVPEVAVRPSLLGVVPLARIEDPVRRARAGDALLRLYFGQWLVEDGLFLDLRATHLGLDDDDRLHFAPSGLWIQLRPEFRTGMVALYRAFYSGDEAALDVALRRTGLLRPGLDAAAEQELEALLAAHFGIDQRAQHFELARFRASFDALFAFFVDHGYRLHSDFVFVGFYLITLYRTLERLGQAHDVRRLCAETLLAPEAASP